MTTVLERQMMKETRERGGRDGWREKAVEDGEIVSSPNTLVGNWSLEREEKGGRRSITYMDAEGGGASMSVENGTNKLCVVDVESMPCEGSVLVGSTLERSVIVGSMPEGCVVVGSTVDSSMGRSPLPLANSSLWLA